MKSLYIKLLINIVIGLVSQPVFTANSFSYTPEESVKERLREGIEYAQQSIDMCIHNFAALDIGKDLGIARDRGVRVRVVILEHDNTRARSSLAETLIHNGFDTRILKTRISADEAEDFVLLDDRILVTGVYNWLAYQDRTICDDVLFHYDPERIRTYKNTFYALFTNGKPAPFLDNRKELAATNNSPVSASPSPASPTALNQITDTDKKPGAPEKSSISVQEPASGDFGDISFEELDKYFGKESTLSRSEKKELWKKYKGKYVRWNGIVSYKGMGRVDWNRIGVSRQRSKNAEVEIVVDWRMFEKVMNLKVGSVITYTGKLVSRPWINAPYRLDDANIE